MRRRALLLLLLALAGCAHRRHSDRVHVSTITDVGLRFVFFDLGRAAALEK